ncbi:phage portal protein, HK97 family [Klebsiella pneumoniae]|nr:phage portal protein, HK97 family [Klebsiella pneumoniae]
MVQMLAKATNNNIEHQGLQFVMYTLLAWLKRHEGALQRDLLLPSERRDLYIEFNVYGLLRGDHMRWAASGDGYPLTISGVWRICRQLPAGINT